MMMVQIWIFVYESSPQTASRQVLPTTTHAIFTFCSDLRPCQAVGRTGPRMEFDAYLRITEMFFRSSSSHDRRMHHGKVLVRKTSSEVKKRESEREREREREHRDTRTQRGVNAEGRASIMSEVLVPGQMVLALLAPSPPSVC